MPLSDARALLPALMTQPLRPDADARALQALAEWCQRYTPWTSTDGETGLWLDITGAAHLLGGEDNLLADLAARLTHLGFENRLGLADTAGTAWAVARFAAPDAPALQNVPPGGMAEALEKLPLQALRLEDSCLHLLKRFGLKTIGELCRLPRSTLKSRFPSDDIGQAVLHRLDQALGRAGEPLTPLMPPPVYVMRKACPEPILETDSFQFVLEELLQRLCTQLEDDGMGAKAVTFSAYRADGGVSRIAIATARASCNAAHLAYLFRDKLEAIDPGFGVDVLTLAADTVEALDAKQLQLTSSQQGSRNDGALERLIDRLSNRLGAASVQYIVGCESHIPERAERRVQALKAERRTIPQAAPQKPARPFRLLARPEAIQVMAEVPEGPPMRFTWRRVTHRVIHAEGPERIAAEWWHRGPAATARTRDYYHVEDSEGRRFWLFREGLYSDTGQDQLPSWHMHGLFA